MKKKAKPRGRNGGRPKLPASKKKEKTKVMRVPLSNVKIIGSISEIKKASEGLKEQLKAEILGTLREEIKSLLKKKGNGD